MLGAAGVPLAAAAAAGGSGGPPARTEAIGPGCLPLVEQHCVGASGYVCRMRRTGLAHGIPEYIKLKKKQLKKKHVSMHHLVRDSKPLGPATKMARRHKGDRVSWASLPCHGPGRVETLETLVGRAEPGRETF